MNADAAAPPRRRLAGGALIALATQLIGLGAGAATSIVIARLTGAEGSGTYGLALGLTASATVLFGLGLTAGVTFHVSRGWWPLHRAWRDVERAGAISGLAAGMGVVIAQLLGHASFLEGISLLMALAVAFAMPFALVVSYSSAFALAMERYELYGFAQAIQALAGMVATVALVVALGPLGAVIGLALSYPPAFIALHVRLRRILPAPNGAEQAAGRLRDALSFGSRAWGADVLQLLNYRLDLFVLNAYVERAVVGRYSVAVALTALAWILPSALQTVLFPRAASTTADAPGADESVIAALRHSIVLLTTSGLAVLGVLAAAPVLYGADFQASTAYGAILLPGVLAIGFAKSLSAVITGRGFPQYSLYNAAATMPLTVGLYFVLIPRFGGTGAAVASSASYVASTLIAIGFFKRVTGIPLTSALRSPRSIADDYVDAARNLRLYGSSVLRSSALSMRRVCARGRSSLLAYDPERYWEKRATDLIATYDRPDTWAERGWTRGGVEEALVPRLLQRTHATSAFVVGAGSGRQYGFLEPLGLEVRGIDISATLAAESRHRYPHIRTDTDSIVGAELRHAPADALLSTAVLQHVRPEDLPAAVASVQALACKVVILREVTWLARQAAYMWAHDYPTAFAGWQLAHDEVTDRTERFEVRLLAFVREDSV